MYVYAYHSPLTMDTLVLNAHSLLSNSSLSIMPQFSHSQVRFSIRPNHRPRTRRAFNLKMSLAAQNPGDICCIIINTKHGNSNILLNFSVSFKEIDIIDMVITLSAVQQQRVIVPNNHGEKLVGMLHESGSKEIVILCHGFRSSKVSYSVFGFDFVELILDRIDFVGTDSVRIDFEVK